ncbi:hypothetical protein EDC01DRAFT_114826 [Geopyxis carbonaria]|nr:hypothetical protein EDC01DRAFT_114826 [Geopyxis carbonaria]
MAWHWRHTACGRAQWKLDPIIVLYGVLCSGTVFTQHACDWVLLNPTCDSLSNTKKTPDPPTSLAKHLSSFATILSQ